MAFKRIGELKTLHNYYNRNDNQIVANEADNRIIRFVRDRNSGDHTDKVPYEENDRVDPVYHKRNNGLPAQERMRSSLSSGMTS